MSENIKKEIASALKWALIIVVASIAYKNIAPNYYFMRQGHDFYRGNKVTGTVEQLEDNVWADFTESVLAYQLRKDAKERKDKEDEKLVKKIISKRKKDLHDDEINDFFDNLGQYENDSSMEYHGRS
jgi:hypothetical protein